MPTTTNPLENLELEHIDPRKGVLICGLKNELNEIIADSKYNNRKNCRFVPYRICDYPAPITFGDTGEFLIDNEWRICEFGGKEWWKKANKYEKPKHVIKGKTTIQRHKENGTFDDHMDKMRSKIDHKSRTDALIKQENFVGNQPWWHRFVDGKIERKRSFTKPEGANWKSGKGDSYQRKRVRCTVTGHEGTQQSLARWQKNRGIDTSNRIFIGDFK
jgi:hypothetical protein